MTRKTKDETMCKPTTEIYSSLAKAYDHFNTELFNGRLPDCVIVMHRKKGAYGYFWSEQWSDGSTSADEIALNPDLMASRPITETLSTLVHEMCHLEQAHFGKPSRNGYHNKQWAEMMDFVGLVPHNVKDPSKRTGQSCSHTIKEHGVFATATAQLIADGFQLDWATKGAGTKEKKKSANKIKYICDDCDTAAWGKPGLLILCADHEQLMMAVS